MYPKTERTSTFGTLTSSSDLSTYVGKIVKISSAQWAAGSDNDGIGVVIDGGAASGDNCEVGFGECYAITGGTIATGALVSCNGSSVLISAVSGDSPIGRCLAGAGSGEWAKVFIYGVVDEAVA